ncbi:DUF4190 domain-containing protein [Candidatus Saccharibacteria bacterium]|nr:DUF4190 domain-containing protein [Candidatus Saccharibacteria bacterium]
MEEKYAKMLDYNQKKELRKKSSGHIASFVLGLFAVLGVLFWYVSLPCGILAIVLGAKSARRTGSKLAKAGLILGIIGLVISLFLYVTVLFLSLLQYL